MPNSPAFANKIARITTEIAAFEALVAGLKAATMQVESLGECLYLLKPRQSHGQLPNGKIAALTLLGLIHGNEVGGIAVLNELLRALAAGAVVLHQPLIVGLGNPAAARQDVRFLERDLNRSFMREQQDSAEAKRAKILEAALAKTAYLLDFHQTREKSENPFFIFPYTKAGFDFAQAIAPHVPVVTHWGKPYSVDGRCSDEYVNAQGGVGITIEIGQNGFEPFSVGAGFWIAVQTLRAVNAYMTQAPSRPKTDAGATADIYTWLEVAPYPSGDCGLEPGWHNFSHIKAGQRIGQQAGQPIVAKENCWILFPQYPKPKDSCRPAEFYRLMRKITKADLPA